MFGKFFASTFSGSMMSAGADVFAVWGYVIAHTVKSRVELNPKFLSMIIGTTPERVQSAIDYLAAPDAESRTPDHDGRRIIKENGFQYLVVNHDKYRSILNEDDRREYNRIKKRESRERRMSNHVSMTVNDCPRQSIMSAHTEAEAEAEADISVTSVTDIKRAKSKIKKTTMHCPVDFRPSEETMMLLEAELQKPPDWFDGELKKFIDHFTEGKGHAERRPGWDASYRTWCRNAAQWGAAASRGAPHAIGRAATPSRIAAALGAPDGIRRPN